MTNRSGIGGGVGAFWGTQLENRRGGRPESDGDSNGRVVGSMRRRFSRKLFDDEHVEHMSWHLGRSNKVCLEKGGKH